MPVTGNRRNHARGRHLAHTAVPAVGVPVDRPAVDRLAQVVEKAVDGRRREGRRPLLRRRVEDDLDSVIEKLDKNRRVYIAKGGSAAYDRARDDAASLIKRWLPGTHQGSVEAAHLPSYLNEFVFRFNRRRSRSRGLVFYRVLELAIAHDRVVGLYKDGTQVGFCRAVTDEGACLAYLADVYVLAEHRGRGLPRNS